MGSLKSWVKRRTAVATRMAFAIVICILALEPATGHPQEIVEPRVDNEIAKQEKIYQSRGTDVPQGYVTQRGLSDYAALLPAGFCDALSQLHGPDRWLDIGAGAGQAILDYYAPQSDALVAAQCATTDSKAHAVAMSIEDRRTDAWYQRTTKLGDDRIKYLTGKRLRNYSVGELGKFQIITDVFGGFSYTEDLSQFVEKILALLEVGGSFYTLVPGVQLADGKHKLGTWYLTELEDAVGRPRKVCSWLKQCACAQVTCESKSDWKRPTELITIRKLCNNTSVPRMKLLEFEAGYPPGRRFQLED